MVGVVFAVSGGLVCGKEGPLVHTGAVFPAEGRLSETVTVVFELSRSNVISPGIAARSWKGLG